MSSADEWRRVCAELARAEPAAHEPIVESLYALARETGVACLRRRWGYSVDEALDVVHDVLAARWDAIIAAEESPKALFLTILLNRARDRHRRMQREEALPGDPRHEGTIENATAGLALSRVLLALRTELSARDLRVFSARCIGVSSREVADAEGLSPANVDQIVSRARARLKELLDADSE